MNETTNQPPTRRPLRGGRGGRLALRLAADEGQTTAEYALVLLAAGAVALLLLAWASGTDGITRLLDAVIDSIIGKIA
jgi:hypothetical protein